MAFVAHELREHVEVEPGARPDVGDALTRSEFERRGEGLAMDRDLARLALEALEVLLDVEVG